MDRKEQLGEEIKAIRKQIAAISPGNRMERSALIIKAAEKRIELNKIILEKGNNEHSN